MKKQLLILAVPVFILASVAFAKPRNIVIERNVDPRLFGTWASECLTPRPQDDTWSERHTFVFNSNGTATHTRASFDKSFCQGSITMNLVNNYRYKTHGNVIDGSDPTKAEGGGLIDLTFSKSSGTIYDMYVVSGGVLMLGHGFRNLQSYAGAMSGGLSPATRISSLNQYIVYKKLGK